MAYVSLLHLEARVCPLAATPCRLDGGASKLLLPASAFLPESLARSQLLLPREIVRFQVSLGTRRIVRSGVRLEGGTGGRAEGENSVPERIPPAGEWSLHRSAQTHTNDTGIVGGATVILREDVDPKAPHKTCTTCDHIKFLEDFERTISSSDGRSNVCRACLAPVKAMRAGKELYHLSLSVDEAWALAKSCTKCGLVKELRDFTRNAARKDHVEHHCRACASAYNVREPRHVPTDQPQLCITCREVKAADQFYINRKRQKGRMSTCKLCSNKQKVEVGRRVAEAQLYIKRKTKLCTGCGKEKPASMFNVDRRTIDGLTNRCRLCKNLLNRVSNQNRKQSGQQEL